MLEHTCMYLLKRCCFDSYRFLSIPVLLFRFQSILSIGSIPVIVRLSVASSAS
jgi:hypothetical protein